MTSAASVGFETETDLRFAGPGGAGGTSQIGQGGNGGGGGFGLRIPDAAAATVTIGATAVLQGGAGGAGGIGNGGANNGAGGAGGGAILGQNITILNSGTIRAGDGGTGSTAGAGGIGVEGTNISITQLAGATLAGGLSGAGIQALAVKFNGGANAISFGGTTSGLTGDISVAGSMALTPDAGGTTVANIISGTGSVSKEGSGTLTLSGTNTYTGATTILNGTLQFGGNNIIANGSSVVINGASAILNIQTFNDTVAGVSLQAGSIAGTTGVLTSLTDFDVRSGSASAILSGAVGLTKTTAGAVTLSGDNTYTGATNISAGSLTLGHQEALGSQLGSLSVVSTGALDLGGFTVTKSTFTLSGATTLISNGTLVATGGYAVASGTISANLSGAGGLVKSTPGTVALTGVNTYGGATTINAGILQANSTDALGWAGNTLIFNGGTLQATGAITSSATRDVTMTGAGTIDTNGNAVSIAGIIAGAGTLAKAGTGTFTLSGINTYTGGTSVLGGALIVNGSIASSSGLTVAAGATLAGSGILPSTLVNGTLAPGNSPGTLTVNGNLVLGAGSLYLAEVQGPLADRINVTGTASLAGALRLVPLGGAYLFAAPYTLLSAAGGLGGTSFGTVDTTGSFGDGVTSSIAYTGTEIRLTLTPKPLAPIVIDPVPPGPTPSPRLGVGRPANALSVASGIDAAVAAGADPSLLFAIYNLPAAAIPAAVNQLSGEVHTAAPAMANRAAGQFLGTMLDGSGAGRLAGSSNGPGGAAGFTADLPSKHDGPGRTTFDPARFSLWGATFGSTGRNDGDRAVGSANRNLSDAHVAVGADIRLGSNTVAGVAVAGGQARASLSGGLGKAEADVFQAGLYGRTTLGAVNLAAALGYARLDTDTARAIPALGRTGVAASYATQAWSGRIEASLPVAGWGSLTLSPLAAFQAVRAASPAAIERDGMGATAGTLTLAGRSDITSRSEFGLQVDAKLLAGASPVIGFVRVAWAHYYQRDADLTASLNGLPGASFAATGARPDRNTALLAAGADIRLSQAVSLGMRVDSELSANTRRIGGTAQLRVSF
ncbi:MAG: autotransporter domain-containing protein [Kaiparowitsia implicata GSE-PSE-MK54-09C]|jgi:autotransporter-associated beta strand protein|nr:autotransporter domain-containing protein [Kaiparowitsia implicata GSE-PSE-MK54-09C]